MPRQTPASSETVYAISDARRAVLERLSADGVLCMHDQAALLLLDTAAYQAQKSDLVRRERQSIENYGHIVPRILRELDELERTRPDAQAA